ncbi:MAG: M15 family metallopeptidase [Eubacteriales bacterium]|nr:M15 family metallopeptidase [Eubacteriales bacterium]
MTNEKKIKSIIIISLILIESFVWIINNPDNSWNIGNIGGADGSTKKLVGQVNNDPQYGNVSEKPDVNERNQNGSFGNKEEPAENDDNRKQLLKEAAEKGLLILVNKENSVPPDYKPDDLKAIKYFAPDRSEASRYMRAEAAEAFHQMVDKAAEAGVEIKMTTAYRSYHFQKNLYDNYVARKGQAEADTFSAKPGQSEHQTGLAVDVSSPSVGYQLSNDYGDKVEGKWLAENAYRFGFILRFPKGKEHITGFQYEPWHLRYVGLTAAKEIYEQGLSLEEYLQQNDIESR